MKAFELEITCTMEGGTELVAMIDQRDYAAYERSDLYRQDPPVSAACRSRWLAWNALRRTGSTSYTWDEFDLEQCAAAIITDFAGKNEPDQEGEEEPDPSRS